jgi:hypothetical protein
MKVGQHNRVRTCSTQFIFCQLPLRLFPSAIHFLCSAVFRFVVSFATFSFGLTFLHSHRSERIRIKPFKNDSQPTLLVAHTQLLEMAVRLRSVKLGLGLVRTRRLLNECTGL